MSGFNSFIVIDIETTGLDPAYNEIIELGAVRYADGAIAERFTQLVKPSIPIPAEITGLTGITDKMVENSPDIDSVFDKYYHLIESSPWIVGHNVSFDLGFLGSHLTKQKAAMLEAKSLDTGVLARVLLPRLPRFSLASLVSHLGVERKQAHRALDDSLATAEIYLKLISHLASLPVSMKEEIGRMLLGADGIDIFRRSLRGIASVSVEMKAAAETAASGAPREWPVDLYPENVAGEVPPASFGDYVQVDPTAVENHFLPGGVLSSRMPSYEYRPQQVTMAKRVAESVNRSEFLLAEAPTGVGKSLAYLLPASWWASLNRERIVISTQTKSLQSQLFYKDLPQVQKAVGYKFKAALVKGKGNYLCLYKFHELLAEAEVTFNRQDREALASLIVWAKGTGTGDISECNGFNPSHNFYLWSRISCEGSFCLGQGCHYADRCFLLRIRSEAQTSQIIVTNHHLTFADFASGGELTLSAGNVIFDEAHNLEKIAASYLGSVFDKRSLEALLSDMYASRPRQSGFLLNLKMALSRSGGNLIMRIDSVIDAIIKVGFSSNHLFEKLSQGIQAISRENDSREIAFTDGNNPCDVPEREELLSDLQLTSDRLDILIDSLRDEDEIPKRREHLARLEALASDLKAQRETASDVLYASSKDFVYWIERPSSQRYAPRVLSAPLEVGRLLDSKFYDHLKTAVFTSATLAVEKRFDYIIQRLGLDMGSRERMTAICLDSPFDIDSQVAVISAGYLPSPKQAEFEAEANDSLKDILVAGSRKAMVLFTSHRSLKNSTSSLTDFLEGAGIELFSQETSFSSERIFRRFKAARRAVLFGTDTFWEGIDLPGELLELLVLFKLPFTAPERPWFKANLERIEQAGESSFARLSLPDAVVKFRQGFGRLIRTSTDRGCVVVLDSRIEKSSFGRVFLNSVGGTKHRCKSSEEIAGIIREWLKLATPKG